MNVYVALLRAINVGGTGKLPMAELKALCEACGFERVTTYIQSGNVVFRSKLPLTGAKAALEKALAAKMGKPYGVLVRTAAELRAVAEQRPFPGAAPNRVLVFFFDEAPPEARVKETRIPGKETLHLRGRELFIHFPDGMGQSKLKVPFQKTGTGRNMNTVDKLVSLVDALEGEGASAR